MDFRALSDPVVVVSDKGSSEKPSFFKKIKPPFTNFSSKKIAAVGLTVLLLFAIVGGVYISRKPTQLKPQATVAGVEVSLKPTDINTTAGQDVNVDVFIDTNTTGYKVAAVQAKVNFNPEYLQYTSTDLKTYLPVILTQPQSNNGAVSFTLGSNPSDPKTGSGVIATIKFKALKNTPTSGNPLDWALSFDSQQTLVAALEQENNVAGNLNPANLTIGGSGVNPSPSPTGPETSFSLDTTATNTAGQEFTVYVYTRSDVDAANLWHAALGFNKDKLEVVRVDKTQSFVTTWAEEFFDNSTGEISLTGGVPNPGLKTQGINTLFAKVVFKGKVNGVTNITLAPASGIYRNTDNANILQVKRDTETNITGGGTPSPSPSPSCLIENCNVSPRPSVDSHGKGDGDNNGKVDLRDLSILLSKWSTVTDITSFFQLDFNDDKRINSFDFSAMNDLLFQLGVISRR